MYTVDAVAPTDQHAHGDAFIIAFGFGVGAVHEERSQAGISHVLEHMLYDAADKHSVVKSLADISSWNAETHHDFTCYYAAAAPADSELAIVNLFAVISRFGNLSTQEFERERRVVLEEMARLQPGTEAAALNALFAGTPYAHSIIGTRASLASLDVAALRAFYGRHYRNVHVVISCRCPKVRAAAKRLILSLLHGSRFDFHMDSSSRTVPREPSAPRKEGTARDTDARHAIRVVVQKSPNASTTVTLALRAAPYLDATHHAHDVYAFTAKRQLMKVLRHELGLIYGCSMQHDSYACAGAMHVTLTSASGDVDQLVQAMLRVLKECVPRVQDARVQEQHAALTNPSQMEQVLHAVRRAVYKHEDKVKGKERRASAASTNLITIRGMQAVLVVGTRQRTNAAMRSAWEDGLSKLCELLQVYSM